jgi:hypothetical protein
MAMLNNQRVIIDPKHDFESHHFDAVSGAHFGGNVEESPDFWWANYCDRL